MMLSDESQTGQQQEAEKEDRLAGDQVFTRVISEIGCDYRTRQPLIERIQRLTGNKLVSYVALFGQPGSEISPEDILPFSSLLADLGRFKGLDVMIHSSGGNADVAEKLIMMCRTFTKRKSLRMIVPNYAKSAATLFGLGTDEILMGYTSELGPIDPQVPQIRPGNLLVFISAKSFRDSLEKVKKEAEETQKLNLALVPILSNIDLAFLDAVEKSIQRTEQIAVNWLHKHMLKGKKAKAKTVAESLLDVERYRSHGQTIDYKEAKRIGLNATYLSPEDQLWRLIWELYCRSEAFLRRTGNVKLFESDSASTLVGAQRAG